MNLVEMAAQLFLNKLGQQGGGLDMQSVIGALQHLLPTKNGELDLAALVAQFTGEGGGLAELANSWLSNGANLNISAEQITSVFGRGPLADFAAQLGLSTDTAASGLADTVPELIDKSSENGSLLNDQMVGLAKSVLGKLF